MARGAKSEAHVVVAEVSDGHCRGRGEAVPYARYGETVAGVVAALEAAAPAVAAGLEREALADLGLKGAARNALDCALWDLEAKQSGVPVWQRAGLPEPAPMTTAFTLSLDEPEAMAAAARAHADRPILKLKLDETRAYACVAAVHDGAPRARLIVDANESWRLPALVALAPALAPLGVVLIEQPLPAANDSALASYRGPIPLCADESALGLASLPEVAERYQAINIKLDKTGGLSEAIALERAARAQGLMIMLGCMVATSLAMAPALLIASGADFVDLDGPLHLREDRPEGLRYEESRVAPPEAALWG